MPGFLAQQDRGDQIAALHEEEAQAEARAEIGFTSGGQVRAQHQQHRDGAQAVY